MTSFIESPFSTRVEYEAWVALPAAERPAALAAARQKEAPSTAPTVACPVLPAVFERRDGTTTGQEALCGKIVVLFFSSEWCPACKSFIPVLKTLYEDGKENGKVLEVVYVSSDNDAAQKARYMEKHHGDWLSVPFSDKAARDTLKTTYGCFAGKEAPSFPGVPRRAGIPSIVIISPTGDERVHMDCDPPTEIMRKGDAILDEWVNYRW
jgi:thiol-disulfide isomerase/thioredoxin